MFKIQKLDLLISIYIFCLCAAELMGSKLFPITTIGTFPLRASVAIFLIPVLFSINDIITEVHGKERARSIIRSGIVVIFLLFLTSAFFTWLEPAMIFQKKEAAYDLIFGMSARFAAASLIAFAISDFLDVYIFAAIRKSLGAKALWLRNNASNIIAQFVDTTLFVTLAFYAIDKSVNDNFPFLIGIILPYWLIKCFMSVIETPFVYLGVNWLKDEKK